jgi:hypothetical protein
MVVRVLPNHVFQYFTISAYFLAEHGGCCTSLAENTLKIPGLRLENSDPCGD